MGEKLMQKVSMVNASRQSLMGVRSVAFCALLSALAISGCSTERLMVQRMKPAEVNLVGYKSVAVAGIAGPGGSEVSDLLTQSLFQSNRFKVVDRSALSAVLAEQDLGGAGIVDEATAARMGKIAGADAIVVGRVTRRDYNENRTRDDITCYEKKQEIPCFKFATTGNWALNLSVSVIDTSSGSVVATKALVLTDEKEARTPVAVYRAYPPNYPAITWDPESVFGDLQRQGVGEFMKAIAPYPVNVNVELYAESAVPGIESGVNLAKAGDWAGAIRQFEGACPQADAAGEAKVSARCWYNLGIAYGYSGADYEKAEQYILKAIAIQDETTFSTELAKIRGFRTDAQRLKEQSGGS